MLDKNKVKQLFFDLITYHNYMVNNREFRSDLMVGASQNSIGHLLLCAEDAGYITEAELNLFEDQILKVLK